MSTKQDINLGIEIAEATSLLKPVIIFYKEKISSIPFSLKEEQRTRVFIVEYNDENMKQKLEYAVSLAIEELDVRFNMMLPSNLSNFLSKEAKLKNISKAHLIRELLLKHKQEIE